MFKRNTKAARSDGNVEATANCHVGVVRYDVQDVNIDKIVLETQPRRIREQDLERLTDSIARVGLIHPVTVVASSDGTYVLICGRKRYFACKRLGWQTVPCIVKNGPQNDRYA
ncbi:MAG: ParB/RepB/Spo0J family partition protein, partial [Planctomycetota bacterium]